MSTPRYHVQLVDKRTTVTIDHTLAVLLSLKLGERLDTELAHQAVRQWLQNCLDEANDPGRYKVSQWLQSEIILELVDKKVSDLYGRWIDDGYHTIRK